MIDPKAVVTYAQYNEDLILWALLHDVDKGFYVDVGANDPVIDSVTKLFYDHGWRGINIEPLASYHRLLNGQRPKDVNLQVGVGEKSGKAMFREFKASPGHSTFDDTQKSQHQTGEFNDYKVKILTLTEVLKKHKLPHIHFLKIDVEGYEYQVLAGNDWTKFRPEVICIEANHLTSNWHPILTDNGYKPFVSDGLNEYFIANESWQRTEGFAERIVLLDYHALKLHQSQSWADDSKTLTRLHTVVANQDKEIKRLQAEVATMFEQLARR